MLVSTQGCVEHVGPVLSDAPLVPTPNPIAPLGTPDQLQWQTQELAAFLHFGVNTFSDQELSDGTVSPALFNPTRLDASQWLAALQGAGFRRATLTAKHHDGFCLWPSRCTTYSVAASPWLGGNGDVVKNFVEAAHQTNIRVGLALSPIDAHEPTYDTPAYQAVFECQLTELLSNYGDIDELWFWGDQGSQIDWDPVEELVRRLQPHALIERANVVAALGADVRSIGNDALPDPAFPTDQSNVITVPGDPRQAPIWYPSETVAPIRPGWFWHSAEDTKLKTLTQLLDLYYDSAGRNSVLLLGVPPDKEGLFADPDLAQLDTFGSAVRAIYRSNLVSGRRASADSVLDDSPERAATMAADGKLDTFWVAAEGRTTARLEFDLGSSSTFNVVSIQEPIALGERTTQYHLEISANGTWTTIASGTFIGQRKLQRVGDVTASSIALVITQARAAPAIAELGVFNSSFP